MIHTVAYSCRIALLLLVLSLVAAIDLLVSVIWIVKDIGKLRNRPPARRFLDDVIPTR